MRSKKEIFTNDQNFIIMLIDLKNHLNIKINIRGAVQSKISKEDFNKWSKGRNVKFEIQALKKFKQLNNHLN